MDIKRLLRSKLTTLVLTFLLAGILTVGGRLFLQKYQISKEIKDLETRAEELNQKNTELAELVEFYGSEEFAQRQAREKLNLKKEGEYVVSFPQASEDGEVAGSKQDRSNPEKWFDYFFSN